MNLFVDGRYPIGLPALPNRFRLKLQPSAHCIATFYRDGFEADGTALVWHAHQGTVLYQARGGRDLRAKQLLRCVRPERESDSRISVDPGEA